MRMRVWGSGSENMDIEVTSGQAARSLHTWRISRASPADKTGFGSATARRVDPIR
jgi:hypothetical protein